MSLEHLDQCPVCGETSFTHFLTCKDFTTSGESFQVKHCANCQLAVTSPRPTEQQAGAYYHSDTYISHQTSSRSLLDRIYLIIRQFTIKWKFRLVSPYLKNGTLLDIGCGAGSFLTYCQERGFSVRGVEPSEQARTSLSHLNVSSDIRQVADGPFKVITLWHVLEHIYSLKETIHELNHQLEKDGTIFIAVPNRESADANHYREYWAAYDVPRHVWHFSKENIELLMKNAGLRVQEIIPMQLDAYYVCLLSEKYRNKGSHSPLTITRALLNGYRSNRAARTNMNYSSLIYRVTK
jgi:2-polyprenyl-3-methyl-5-hydroxy-6-metoxy-1,4-benzoquinol methylase